MATYYTRTRSHSSIDHYYPSAPSSSTSATRSARRSVRPSPLAPSPPSAISHSAAYASTSRTRPGLTRAPASMPSVPHAPSYSRKNSESSPYSTPNGSTYMRSAASSRSSLRAPRASFDVVATSSNHKHVAFADQRPTLKTNNTWSAGDRLPKPKPFPVNLSTTAVAPPADFKMNPLLAHSRFRRASISYDVQQSPSTRAMIDRRSRTPVSAENLAAPATVPALPCNAQLTLSSSALPWSIVVSPSPSGGSGARHTAITNLDVLAAVHAALQRPASKADWDALGEGSSSQKRVREAFERRCSVSGGREKGLKRVDWLAGKSRLIGVEVDRHGIGATGRLVFSSPK